MKTLPFLMSLIAALAFAGIAHGAAISEYLTAGQIAFQKGDFATAKQNFDIAYRMDPRNPTAIGFLKQIAVRKAQNAGADGKEEALAKLIIPKVEFREATFGAALDFMKKKVEEVSGGKESVNFVVQPEIDRQKTVTLNLTSIPATEALRYIGALTNTKFEFQKYAIMVSPKGPEPAGNQPAVAGK